MPEDEIKLEEEPAKHSFDTRIEGPLSAQGAFCFFTVSSLPCVTDHSILSHRSQSIVEPPPRLSFTVRSRTNTVESSLSPATGTLKIDELFAEKLKYVICTSALLSLQQYQQHSAGLAPPLTPLPPELKVHKAIVTTVLRLLSPRFFLLAGAGSLACVTHLPSQVWRVVPPLLFSGFVISFLANGGMDAQSGALYRAAAAEVKAELLREVERLIEEGVTADSNVDSALNKIKEIECVNRGLGLCVFNSFSMLS